MTGWKRARSWSKAGCGKSVRAGCVDKCVEWWSGDDEFDVAWGVVGGKGGRSCLWFGWRFAVGERRQGGGGLVLVEGWLDDAWWFVGGYLKNVDCCFFYLRGVRVKIGCWLLGGWSEAC